MQRAVVNLVSLVIVLRNVKARPLDGTLMIPGF